MTESGFCILMALIMMPALDYLEHHGHEFGIRTPPAYYFASGALPSVLDHAPTCLNFLTLAEAAGVRVPTFFGYVAK